jgi:hypothetical protein
MARLATSGGRVDFEQKEAKILGTTFHLKHSVIDNNILKKLGLQDVSEEEKQIIMSAFYVTPPKSKSILSLHDYPQIKKIVIPLLVDLIHDQNSDIQILKESAIEEPLVEIVYEIKNNKTIGLSILLPSYLLQDTRFNTSQMIEVTGIKKGLEYGKVNINISNGAMTKKASLGTPGAAVAAVFSNAAEELRKRVNRNRLDRAERRGEPLPPLLEEEADIYTAVAVAASDGHSINSELQRNIDFYERPLTEDEKKSFAKQSVLLSFINEKKRTPFHVQLKTNNTRSMLELCRIHLFLHEKKSGKLSRARTHHNHKFIEDTQINELVHQFKRDILHYNRLTFVSHSFNHTFPDDNGNQHLSADQWRDEVVPIIRELQPYLANIVCSFHQGFHGEPFTIFTNDSGLTIKNIGASYSVDITILSDIISFHTTTVYAHVSEPNNDTDPQLVNIFIGEVTFKIDPLTLNGFIQYDKYYIDPLMHRFEVIYKTNFDVAYNNDLDNVLLTTLKLLSTRLTRRQNLIKAIRDNSRNGNNDYTSSFIENAKSSTQYDIEILQFIVETFELNTGVQKEQLDALHTENVDILRFIENYTAKIETRIQRRGDNHPVSNWYNDMMRTIGTYNPSVQSAIQSIIFDKFMIYLNEKAIEYKEIYDARNENNKKENDSLTRILSDDKLSEIIIQVKGSRRDQEHYVTAAKMEADKATLAATAATARLAEIVDTESKAYDRAAAIANAAIRRKTHAIAVAKQAATAYEENEKAWFTSFTKWSRKRSIIGNIGKRSDFHKLVFEQTKKVCIAYNACVVSATYYRLFQDLVNKTGLHLARIGKIEPYEVKEIEEANCDVMVDKLLPEVEDVVKVVENILPDSGSVKIMSPTQVKSIIAKTSVANKAVAEAEAEAAAEAAAEEDEDAAFVAVAAAAAEDDTFAPLPEHSESVAVAIAAEMDHEAAPIAVQLERKKTNLEIRKDLAAEIATKAKEYANRREVARSKKAENIPRGGSLTKKRNQKQRNLTQKQKKRKHRKHRK